MRQSGDIMFRLADIYQHADVLKMAQEAVLKYGDQIRDEEQRENDGRER